MTLQFSEAALLLEKLPSCISRSIERETVIKKSEINWQVTDYTAIQACKETDVNVTRLIPDG